MSELQLEFKIDQNRIYESPLDTAQRSKALTERNHKGFKPDEIRTSKVFASCQNNEDRT